MPYRLETIEENFRAKLLAAREIKRLQLAACVARAKWRNKLLARSTPDLPISL
jgi:hypothetical protein